MRVENRTTVVSPCTDLTDDEHISLNVGAAINQYGTVPMYDMLSLLPGDFIAILADKPGRRPSNQHADRRSANQRERLA